MEIVPIDLENLNLSSEFIFFYFKLKQSKMYKAMGKRHWRYGTLMVCLLTVLFFGAARKQLIKHVVITFILIQVHHTRLEKT